MRSILSWLLVAAFIVLAGLYAAPLYRVELKSEIRFPEGGSSFLSLPRLIDTDDLSMLYARREIGIEPVLIVTRVFAGPGELPPSQFQAFGVIAFPSRMTEEDTERYEMLCRAFLGTIPHTSETSGAAPPAFLTVWPMETLGDAARANRVSRAATCPVAVSRYGLAEAQRFISAARRAGQSIPSDRGPFLIAWSPGHLFGESDVPLLFRDMSSIVTEQAAEDVFFKWIGDIQRSPDVSEPVPRLLRIRARIREWADRTGAIAVGAIVETARLAWGIITGKGDETDDA
ncbi:MAG: hypothetical protein AAGG09_07855 [Pseudomonadota bacterium]